MRLALDTQLALKLALQLLVAGGERLVSVAERAQLALEQRLLLMPVLLQDRVGLLLILKLVLQLEDLVIKILDLRRHIS